ncbi:MAG: glutamine--fructose-6-phosphate aminotransferase [isomerizing] [Flavobacteriaceae bacterium]|nr:MAG: glutamine--fructose-6-phosphate aminotransferase [isomerizing] [Flavobacteriaceae bacterium]
MCGIVGYIGEQPTKNFIIDGLKKLEYRGYDSAGAFLFNNEGYLRKCKGKVADLEKKMDDDNLSSCTIGMGHTRWATHGIPNTKNSHPHVSNNGRIFIVHNGIIENYASIKQILIEKGYTFQSETDTEVLVNLIEEVKRTNPKLKIGKATQIALNQVVGAFAIVVFDKDSPNELVVAKLGSPLAIGLKGKDFFVGSDPSPFIKETNRCLYLNDYELAILSRKKGLTLRDFRTNRVKDQKIEKLKLQIEQVEKGGFKHFMLKEIFEQPKCINDSLRGRIFSNPAKIKISSVEEYWEKFKKSNRLIFISCGTSWHASLLGEYYFEELARIPVEVEYASEFRYRNPIIYKDDIVIPVSQSGETADTIAALKLAKEMSAFIYGICNVVGSSIARETHTGIYTHAGPEIGVASTKAFTCQAVTMLIIATEIGYKLKKITKSQYSEIIDGVQNLSDNVKKILKKSSKVEEIAKKYSKSKNFLYLGRGYNFPVALEGALKLKEISYIHAEGYPAAEMKHGPIALIDKNMPVVVVATKKGNLKKIVSNVMEIKARGGKVISIVTEGDKEIKKISDDFIEIPESKN